MKQRRLLWGLAVLALFAPVGCGGDDDEGDGGTGATGTGGTGTTGTGGAAGSGGTAGTGGMAGADGSQNVSCEPADDGVCENETDCPLVETGQARTSAQTCGLGCLGDPDEETCAVECIVMDVGITEDCAACYAGSVKCASDNCLADCASDPASDACNQCQIDAGCRSDFNDCSGLEG